MKQYNLNLSENDDQVIIKRKEIHYQHESFIYIPWFQKDFEEDGTLRFSPTFENHGDYYHDEQMAWATGADYVQELKGEFNVKTKPFKIGGPDETI
jgi:DNA helicase IV